MAGVVGGIVAGVAVEATAGAAATDPSSVRLRFRLALTADRSSALTQPSRLKSNRPASVEVVLSAPLTALQSENTPAGTRGEWDARRGPRPAGPPSSSSTRRAIRSTWAAGSKSAYFAANDRAAAV